MFVRGTFVLVTLIATLLTGATAARADYAAAIAAYNEGDYGTALAEFTPMGQKGDPRAQFHLGEMYYQGFGVEVDHFESFRWYRRAAENGHATAQLRVGAMMVLGLGTDQSPEDAYYWLALSILWNDGPLRQFALQSLSDVASHLTPEEKAALEASARDRWGTP